MIFTRCVTLTGEYNATFVFQTQKAMEKWIASELPELEKRYGTLEVNTRTLQGLKVGDSCKVVGDGDLVYVIRRIREYSPNNYGFILDSGWVEPVYKCYKV